MNAPEPGDRPSLGKVYDTITAVATDVAVIKSEIVDLKDHEHRLRSLERRSWSLAGLAAVAGATLGQIIDRITQ